jgi:hypothetical protein
LPLGRKQMTPADNGLCIVGLDPSIERIGEELSEEFRHIEEDHRPVGAAQLTQERA